jgi:hypothetical protein
VNPLRSSRAPKIQILLENPRLPTPPAVFRINSTAAHFADDERNCIIIVNDSVRVSRASDPWIIRFDFAMG